MTGFTRTRRAALPLFLGMSLIGPTWARAATFCEIGRQDFPAPTTLYEIGIAQSLAPPPAVPGNLVYVVEADNVGADPIRKYGAGHSSCTFGQLVDSRDLGGVFAVEVAGEPGTNVYVAGGGGGNIRKLDGAFNTVATIPAPFPDSRYIAYSPTAGPEAPGRAPEGLLPISGRLWVGSRNSTELRGYLTSTFMPADYVAIDVGANCTGLGIRGSYLYVGLQSAPFVKRINLNTNAIDASWTVLSGLSLPAGHELRKVLPFGTTDPRYIVLSRDPSGTSSRLQVYSQTGTPIGEPLDGTGNDVLYDADLSVLGPATIYASGGRAIHKYAVPPTPPVISGIDDSNGDGRSVVQWSGLLDGTGYYEILRKGPSDPDYSVTLTYTSTGSSHGQEEVLPVPSSGTYSYKIRARLTATAGCTSCDVASESAEALESVSPTTPQTMIYFPFGDYAGSEGTTIDTQALRSGPVNKRNAFKMTFSGTASRFGDFTVTGLTGLDSLIFNPGETSRTVSLNALDDAVSEGSETGSTTPDILAPISGGAVYGGAGLNRSFTITDQPRFVFEQSAHTSPEGTNVDITVLRKPGYIDRQSVTVALEGNAVEGIDYTVTSGLEAGNLLTFNGGDDSKIFRISLSSDAIPENSESIVLTLYNPADLDNPPGPPIVGSPASAVVTVTDNAVIQFDQATYSDVEGSTVDVDLKRLGPSGSTQSVTVQIGGTATENTDYTRSGIGLGGVVTFNPGDLTKTLQFSLTPDAILEGDQTIVLTLVNPTGGAVIGATSSSTITITDASVLQFESSSYSGTEGSTVNVKVLRTGPSTATQSATVSAGGDATPNVDYTISGLTGNQVTFDPGQTSKTLVVTLLGDASSESQESILLSLSVPSGGAVIGPQTSTTVVISDPSVLSFAQAAYPGSEGSTVDVTVNRTGPTTAAQAVTLLFGGSAADPADYTQPLSGGGNVLTFSAGQTSRTFTLTLKTDGVIEGDETINLTLIDPTNGAQIGNPSSTTVTIADGSVIQFAQAAYTGQEGGTVDVVLTRSGPTTTTQAVTVTPGGTATSETDYTISGLTGGAVTFNPGDVNRTVTVTLLTDAIADNNETVTLAISNPTNGASLGATGTTTVTLSDGAVIQFAQPTYSGLEGTGLDVTVNRTGPVTATQAVTVSVTGTATEGDDFTKSGVDGNSLVTFGPGDLEKKIHLTLALDSETEGNETVILTLVNPTNGAAVGSIAATTVTITDRGVFRFGAPGTGGTEGSSINVTVFRDGARTSVQSVTVDFTGTATEGLDYAKVGRPPGSITLTFQAGDPQESFTLNLIDDGVPEGSESIVMSLSGPTNNAALGNPSTQSITVSDGGVSVIEFEQAVYPGAEGGGVVDVKVNRTGPTAASHGVRVSLGGSAGSGDYTLSGLAGDSTLTFAAGQTSKTLSLTPGTDASFEGEETVVLTLSNPTGGATLGSILKTTVNVADGPALEFETANAAGIEGNDVTLDVVRSGPTARQQTVAVLLDGEATEGIDYSVSGLEAQNRLTFEVGDTRRTVTFHLVADGQAEVPESIDLHLSGPTGGASIGLKRSSAIAISDGAVLQFERALYIGSEGTVLDVAVRRTGPVTTASSVTVILSGSAGQGSDYSVSGFDSGNTLSFGPGDVSRTLSFALVADGVTEPGGETIGLALTGPTGGATLGDTASAVIQVSDGAVIQFASSGTIGEEGDTVLVVVNRSGTAESSQSVQIAPGGDATEVVDYELLDLEAGPALTFSTGETSRSFRVALKTDTDTENQESILLSLTNPSNGAAIGSRSTTTIAISDRSVIQFEEAASDAGEGLGHDVGVLRNGPTTGTQSVVVTFGGSAVSVDDYEVSGLDGGNLLTFGPGDSRRTIQLSVLPDAVREPAESITLNLSEPTGGALIGNPAVTTVRLTDGPVLQFLQETYSGSEGTNVEIKVSRSGPTTGIQKVTVTPAGSATLDTDYTMNGLEAGNGLTFNPSDLEKSFMLTLNTDASLEGSETVELSLSSPSGGASIGPSSSTTVTVTDGAVIRFSQATWSESEGTNPGIVVNRDGAATAIQSVTVTFGGTATQGTDYTASGLSGGVLTFGVGQTNRTITLTLAADGIEEPADETIVMTLTDATSGAVIGSPGSATVTVLDAAGAVENVNVTLTARQFSAVTFPFALGSGQLRDKLSLEFGETPDGVHWKMARYASAAGRYVEIQNDTLASVLGQGFWLIASAGRTLSVQGPLVAPPVQSLSLDGGDGAPTMFGTAYLQSVRVQDVMVSFNGGGPAPLADAANVWTEHGVQAWDGRKYVPATTLAPGRAYWIRRGATAGHVELSWNRPAASAGRGEVNPAGAPEVDEPGTLWTLTLTAGQGEQEAAAVRLGSAPGTDAGWDPLSLFLPPFPPGSDAPLLAVSRGEWGAMSGLYVRDFVPPGSPADWVLVLGGFAPFEPVVLDVRGDGLVPDDLEIAGEDGAWRSPLKSGSGVTIPAGVRRVRVRQGAGAPRPPVDLMRVLPNPFTGTVSFLASPSIRPTGAARVYDSLGRRVCDLTQDLGSSPATFHWNGLAENRESAPAGVYFIEFRTDFGSLVVRAVRLRR